MVRIGTIGIGFMGWTHYQAVQQIRNAKLTAICTRDPKKLAGDWTMIQGNFGRRGEQVDLSKVNTYDDIDAFLADPDIDMVDICLPCHLHKEVTIKALKAGKHVLLEKPISVSMKEANEMSAAAEKSGRLFMVAHVLPFFPEFAYAYAAVSSGKYGELLGGHLHRIISKPNWSPDLVDLSKSGGPGIDLHIHDTHFIQLMCGVPDAVFSRGVLAGGDYLQYVTTQYIYNDRPNLNISCASGGICQRGRPFAHGFEIYMEKASLLYGGDTPLTLLDHRGKVTQPKLKSTDPVEAFVGEIKYAVNAIEKGTEPVALSGKGARAALDLCWQEAKSVKTGRVVKIKK